MAKIKHFFLIFIFITPSILSSQINLGASKLNSYISLIQSKKIGVVANQSSVIKKTHLIDTLVELDIDIIKIFSPEHGFRGNKDAGELIKNSIDPITKIPIVSLYGSNKKPSNKDLQDINTIIFDIQDVGVRFYTYISTLHYVMEACAENDIQLIILDRPNPNGHYIDGPILKEEYKSFVGMHPVPIVYGMTIGEYALMINGERWISQKCNLTVIKMDNYYHDLSYDLPIRPSPNLPNAKSINLYPSLCLFEGTNISIGRGTDYPFQHYGSPFIKSKYQFIPKSNFGSSKPKHENKVCFGVDLRNKELYLNKLELNWLISAYRDSENQDDFFNNFFNKLAGNRELKEDIIKGKNESEIKKRWEEDLLEFKKIREKYLLY